MSLSTKEWLKGAYSVCSDGPETVVGSIASDSLCYPVLVCVLFVSVSLRFLDQVSSCISAFLKFTSYTRLVT